MIRGLSEKVIVRMRSGFGRRSGREKQGASKLYLRDWVCLPAASENEAAFQECDLHEVQLYWFMLPKKDVVRLFMPRMLSVAF
jgi:hypothetical protein